MYPAGKRAANPDVCLCCSPNPEQAAQALARDTEAKAAHAERVALANARRGIGDPKLVAKVKAEREAQARRCENCGTPVTKRARWCLRCHGKRRVDEEARYASLTRLPPREVLETEITAAAGLNRLLKSVPDLPRCGCCRTPGPGLVIDPNGNLWCEPCAYYVSACGHCPKHHSLMFYPALSANPVPPPPVSPPRTYTPPPIPVDVAEPA